MSGTGIGRFGGRQRRLAAAQRAYGALPPAQRRVLVLRYVDGLEADAIAARLGTTAPEVTELLVAARGDLLRTPSRPQVTRPPVARPLAMAAVGAAFALTTLSPGGPSPVGTPRAAAPLPGATTTNVVGGEPVALVPAEVSFEAPEAATRVVRKVVVNVPEQRAPETRTPRTPDKRCTGLCLPQAPRTGDSVRVVLPEAASTAIGQKELVLHQEHLPLCEAVPAVPADAASCVPGSA